MGDENELKINYCIKLIEEIINTNDKGGFDNVDNPPELIKYAHLLALLQMRGEMDGIDDLFFDLYQYAINAGEKSIENKKIKGQKIRIVFLVYSASHWSVDSLYNKLISDPRFEVIILLVPLVERTKEDAVYTYKKSCEFFVEKGYDFIDSFDSSNMTVMSWENIGGVPDVLIHLSSWNEGIPDCFNIAELPLTTLNIYIPYAMYTVNSVDGNFIRKFVYDKPFMNIMWRIFVPFDQDKNEYAQFGFLKGINVSVTGYPKMDSLIFCKDYTEDDIRRLWKIPTNKKLDEIKKVVVTPHYTILYGGKDLSLSTFHENAYFLLYLAQIYQDKISFVLKPHPNLRMNAVGLGFFADHEEYDKYIEKWNSLPNAKVLEEREYMDWFATSDGCINDSGSFLLEYQFADKPMLYLRKKSQRLRSSISDLTNYIYNADGGDYCGIEHFLSDVIINGNDYLKESRKNIFVDDLRYDFKSSSGEKIYNIICELL